MGPSQTADRVGVRHRRDNRVLAGWKVTPDPAASHLHPDRRDNPKAIGPLRIGHQLIAEWQAYAQTFNPAPLWSDGREGSSTENDLHGGGMNLDSGHSAADAGDVVSGDCRLQSHQPLYNDPVEFSGCHLSDGVVLRLGDQWVRQSGPAVVAIGPGLVVGDKGRHGLTVSAKDLAGQEKARALGNMIATRPAKASE